MSMLPAKFRTHHRLSTCYCQWCAKVQPIRGAYKLRDGPMDWYFCSDDHALEWLDYRHKTPNINDMLRKTPEARRQSLGKLTIDEFCARELSQRRARLDEIAARSDGSAGICNVHRGDLSL